MKPCRALPPFAPLVLGLLASSCLEFDAQEIHLHHNQQADRLEVMLVYRGLFAERGKVDDALNHWREAQQDGDFAFWNNFPAKVEAAEEDNPLLGRHVEIENGAAFTDPKGVLCAYQFLRVNDVSKLLKSGNTALTLVVQGNLLAKGIDGHEFDDDTRELVREHLRARTPFVSLDGAALRVELPLSAADHRWLMTTGLTSFFEGVAVDIRARLTTRAVIARREELAERGEDEDVAIDYGTLRPNPNVPDHSMAEIERLSAGSAWTRLLCDNPWSLIRENGRTAIVLGIAGQETQVLSKASSGRYEPELLDRMRQEADIEIEVGLPGQELERRFAEFREREAVLPPAYAAKLGR